MAIRSELVGFSDAQARRALEGLPRCDYEVAIKPLRYRSHPHLAARCEFEDHRIVLQIPIPFRPFKEPVIFAARRKRGDEMRFAWETSTGLTNPLSQLARVARDAGKIVVVDGVSSISSIAIETDAWGIDVAVSGSQKGWMAPPGIALVSVSERAWALQATARSPRFPGAAATAERRPARPPRRGPRGGRAHRCRRGCPGRASRSAARSAP